MIWIIGQNGMLGKELGRQLVAAGRRWVGSGRDVDVSQQDQLQVFIAALPQRPRWLVNCSAYTAVDKAELESEACHRINAQGARNLAIVARTLGATLVHISTDYVFDGFGFSGPDGHKRPYLETDATGPQGVYGRSKAEGEVAIREHCPEHMIFRTAWLYGADGSNFVLTMLNLMKTRETLGVVADQTGSPTWTRDLARVLVATVSQSDPEFGTYHVSGEGQCTWFEFAQAIYRGATARGLLDPSRPFTLNPLTTDQYPTKAKRPAWSVLSKAKLQKTLGLSMPPWQQSLDLFLDELQTQGNPRL